MTLYKTANLLLFLTSIFVLNGCSEHSNADSTIERKIIGTWHKELKKRNKLLRVVTKFRADHRFATYARVVGSKRKYYATGRWKVRYGMLIEQTRKSNYVAPGTKTFDKILEINYKQFVYKTENGEILSYYRSNQKAK